jgi:hypothetical protein
LSFCPLAGLNCIITFFLSYASENFFFFAVAKFMKLRHAKRKLNAMS